MSARGSGLDGAIREIVRAEIAAVRDKQPAWSWVACSDLSMSSRSALRLARKENIRATRIAGKVFLHRADLDRIAAANTIDLGPEVDDEVAADFERAFGTGGGS